MKKQNKRLAYVLLTTSLILGNTVTVLAMPDLVEKQIFTQNNLENSKFLKDELLTLDLQAIEANAVESEETTLITESQDDLFEQSFETETEEGEPEEESPKQIPETEIAEESKLEAATADYSRATPVQIAEGEIGTCTWRLYDSGELIIGDGILTTGGISPFRSYRDKITSISFKNSLTDNSASTVKASGSIANLFNSLSNVTRIDLTGFDTSGATDMNSMFRDCSSLTSLDLSNFDTRNVTHMGWMFYDCSNLISLDLSNFNTSNVTSMNSMFRGCFDLVSLDLSNFDTSKVTNMEAMFYDCSSLTSLDLSNFNTSNVMHMNSMFRGCFNLMSLDLSNFDTSEATTVEAMFYDCSSLTSLDLSNFDTRNVTLMGWMFFGCSNLTSLDLSNFNTSKVTTMNRMFSNASKLARISLGSNFRFTANAEFRQSPFLWRSIDGSSQVYTSAEFQTNFGQGDLIGGVYVAVTPYRSPQLIPITNETDLSVVASVTQDLPQQPSEFGYFDLTFSIDVTDHIDWSETDFLNEITIIDADSNNLNHWSSNDIVIGFSEEQPQIVQITLRKELLKELGANGDNQVVIQLCLPLKSTEADILPLLNIDSGYLHVPLAASHDHHPDTVRAEAKVRVPSPSGDGIPQFVPKGSSTADLDPESVVENLTGSFGFDNVEVIGFKTEIEFNTLGETSAVVLIETDLGFSGEIIVPVTVIANPSAYILLPETITLERSEDRRTVGATENIQYVSIDDMATSVVVSTCPEVTLTSKTGEEVAVQVYRQNKQPLVTGEDLVILGAEQSEYDFHLKTNVFNFREVSSYQGTIVFNVRFEENN